MFSGIRIFSATCCFALQATEKVNFVLSRLQDVEGQEEPAIERYSGLRTFV